MSTAAAIAVMFNLLCTGTAKSGYEPNGTDKYETMPFKTMLRIDTKAARWCQNQCRTTANIYSVSRYEIVLQKVAGSASVRHVINRETGDYVYEVNAGGVYVGRKGKCQRQKFTGFPVTQF